MVIRMRPGADGTKALSRRVLGFFAAAELLVLGFYWTWRSVAVPGALPIEPDPAALPWALDQIVHNVGTLQMLIQSWPNYTLLIRLWEVWLGALVLISLFLLKRGTQVQLLFWAGAILIATLPVLESARANLLLLPITLWGLLMAAAVAELWRRASAPGRRLCLGGLILFTVAAPAYGSVVLQGEQRLNNLVWMCGNIDLIYGGAAHASIPPAERELWQAQLNANGIYSTGDFNERWPQLIREAKAKSRYGLDAGGLLFVPRFDFIPWFPGQWHCASYLK
jgi:hypothetical protein